MSNSLFGRWIAVSLLSIVCAAPAVAQGADSRGRSGSATQQAPRNFLNELRDIATALGRRWQTRILVDPSIFVAAPPKSPVSGIPIEKALDTLTGNLKNVAWRRAYLPRTQPEVVPPVEKLVSAIRALDLVELDGVVLENPATRRATSFLKNYPTAPAFYEDLKTSDFTPRPLYVLYSLRPTAGSGDEKGVAKQFVDLQRQQMQMMLQMSPEQLTEAMSQGIQIFQNLDPATRNQLMGNMMRSGMQMFQSLSPAERQQIFQMIGPPSPGGGK